MQLLPEFALRYPETMAEAARLLKEQDARVLAGGTGLIANVRLGLAAPALLVCLDRVPGFRDITEEALAVRLGAGVTLGRLTGDALVAQRFPALAEAAATIAGPSHRTVATVGGNLCLDTRCVFYNQQEVWRRSNGYCLKYRGDTCHVAPQGMVCHAAYAGDLAPVLLALGAEVEVAGPAGARRMPLAALYREDGAQHLTLERGELVVAVHVPVPAPGMRAGYRKSRVRGAIDFPLAGVAVALQAQGGRVRSLRVALTGTNSCPFLLQGTDALQGQAVDDALLDKVKKLVQKQVSPQRTTVTASNYRRLVAAALAARLVKELAA
jgi:4-hydroxybenzoyl-CoA reductase subunit beta